jgi:hypothetical protein
VTCQKEHSSCNQHLQRKQQLHATVIREKDKQIDAAAKEVFQLQGFVLELKEGLAQAVQVSCALSSAPKMRSIYKLFQFLTTFITLPPCTLCKEQECMQETQAAEAQRAEEAAARSKVVTELQAAQVRIATLEDCAAAAEAMSRTEALQTQGLREHVQSLQLEVDALHERCAGLQDAAQRVSVLSRCISPSVIM